ncbi:MAG: hypothetical protein ABIQ64_00975 [Candidatus Saccharimonadales bacterium]
MKQFFNKLMVGFGVSALMVAGASVVTHQASAATNPLDSTCSQATLSGSDVCASRKDELFGPNSFWTRLINTMIMVVGLAATLMVIIGGLRYVLSGGDASQTKSAKDTILYSIVGIVIALMSYALVNFVVVELVK